MNTVKHLNGSKLPPLLKRRSNFWNRNKLICALAAAIMGAWLDIYFIGKGYYHYPVRLFPKIFSVNIGFTLLVLPGFTIIFLNLISQLNKWGKAGLILLISLLQPIFEKLAEELGWFDHSDQWQHLYSFFGYLFFLSAIYGLYVFLEKQQKTGA